MHIMPPDIDSVARSLADWEKKVSAAASVMKKRSPGITRPVTADPLDSRLVIGVDGGLLKHEMHGASITLVRAVAAIFRFRKGILADTGYYPSASPQPKAFIDKRGRDVHELGLSASLARQAAEIGLAAEVAGRKPDLLLLDGSIVPHPSTKPGKASGASGQYKKLVELYDSLFEACEKNRALLAGVVEDSRSSRLSSILKSRAPERVSDTHILSYILKAGERTQAFKYAESEARHPVLQDLAAGRKISGFYIKTSELGRPLRIDFLGSRDEEGRADAIASIILAMSGSQASYGIPSVLIEADQRAKLPEEEMSFLRNELEARTGMLPGLAELRRRQRPVG